MCTALAVLRTMPRHVSDVGNYPGLGNGAIMQLMFLDKPRATLAHSEVLAARRHEISTWSNSQSANGSIGNQECGG
jgi:hypothetical protein